MEALDNRCDGGMQRSRIPGQSCVLCSFQDDQRACKQPIVSGPGSAGFWFARSERCLWVGVGGLPRRPRMDCRRIHPVAYKTRL
jgi:hypothetical protein